MPSSLPSQRARWLRRVRHATTWFAVVGVAIALLIAVVVGNAKPARRGAASIPATETLGAARRAALVHRRAVARRKVRAARVHVRHATSSRRRAVRPVAVAPPVSTPTPPVVVSGGS